MNLGSNKSSKSPAKRSSSEALIQRSAPKAEWNEVCNDNADLFIEMLKETLDCGHSIRFPAPGDSMYPTICHGDVVTVMPIETASISNGDIILYRHRSGLTAHRVMRILQRSEKDSRSALQGPQDRSSSETLEILLRGDAAIHYDDPVSADQILGKVVCIERHGRRLDPYALRTKLLYKTRRLASRLKNLCTSIALLDP